MVRSPLIATLTALAFFTIAVPPCGHASVAPPGCDSLGAPVNAVVDSARHAVIVTLGPCLVPHIGSMHGHDMSTMGTMNHESGREDVRVHFRWPADVWMRSFELRLFDENHKPLTQSTTVHHVEMFNFDRRQVVYPMVERVLGIGEETDGIKLPKSIGLPLDAGMDMGLSVRWNNQTDTDMQGVTVQLVMGYSPRNLVPTPTVVLPFKVDVNLRSDAGDDFDLPPGGGSRSTVFTVGVSGRLLAAGGHLHDFGKEVRLEDVETGKILARVAAHRKPNGEVTGVAHALYGIRGRGPHLIAGRQYRVVAVYEGSSTDSIHGAMGLMGGIFVPDHYAEWPKIDRTNPDYLGDLKPNERTTAKSAAPLAAGATKTNDHPQHQHSP
jgi:hypothetical protein